MAKTIIKKQCSECGMNFPRSGKKTVCSPECHEARKSTYREIHKPHKDFTKKCLICDKIFEHKFKRKYCSSVCAFSADIMTQLKHREKHKES